MTETGNLKQQNVIRTRISFFLFLSLIKFVRSGDLKASLNLQCFFEQWNPSGPSRTSFLSKGLNTTKSSTQNSLSGQIKVSWNWSRMPRGWQRTDEWISKLAETTSAAKLIKCPSDNGIDSSLMKLYGFLQTGNLDLCRECGGIWEAFIDCSNTQLKKRSKEIINPDYRESHVALW